MEAVIIDCKTGEETRRDFTPEEVIQREADTVAALAQAAADALKAQQTADAIAALKLSASKDTQDLLMVLGLNK